jgi:hypothetical protein
MTSEDAKSLLSILAKYPDAFLNNMMVEELGLLPLSGDENPVIGGLCFLSSLIFVH